MIASALGLVTLAVCLALFSSEQRRESRIWGVGFALALLAGAVWDAYHNDRWWMLIVGALIGVLWIEFEKWRERRRPQQDADATQA